MLGLQLGLEWIKRGSGRQLCGDREIAVGEGAGVMVRGSKLERRGEYTEGGYRGGGLVPRTVLKSGRGCVTIKLV